MAFHASHRKYKSFAATKEAALTNCHCPSNQQSFQYWVENVALFNTELLTWESLLKMATYFRLTVTKIPAAPNI